MPTVEGAPDMARELDVCLFSDRVGTLGLLNGRLSFRYRADWLARADAVPLSMSLPLQTDLFEDQQARPFFAGLLPEGQLRQLIARQFHVSRQNDFGLLNAIGGECAGAVRFMTPDSTLAVSGTDIDIAWLSDAELIALLDELPARPMMAGHEGLRLSLAGAQDKLPVIFDGRRIGLPKNGTPSSHILKPAILKLTDTVINEAFCLALANAMGLKPASAQIHSVMGRQFLLVERYDRTFGAQGGRERLHQEDFCQALGIVPEMKYQSEGGPDLSQCFNLVRRATRPSAPQVIHLLDCVIFNALIGNHDAHAKNFSLLYRREAAVLAPPYDLLSTAVYPRLTQKMAMKIGSKYKFSELQQRHWQQFAAGAGLGWAQTRKRILTFAEALPLAARQVQSSNADNFAGSDVVEKIISLIEQRCLLTARRLVGPP